MQEQYVIIVAGGSGRRMKSDIPKQFLEIKGVPIIIRTIRCFLDYNPAIHMIICVHNNYSAYMDNLLLKNNLNQHDIRITIGGETRFESVKNGLALVEDELAIVGIHDAARPFVSVQTIKQCYETAALKGNAIPYVAVNESLRKISNNVNNSVNRNEYKIIQTPQCFLVSKIKRAFLQEYNLAFTDDATVFEATGESIQLVEGNNENIKITSPFDLQIANALMNQ